MTVLNSSYSLNFVSHYDITLLLSEPVLYFSLKLFEVVLSSWSKSLHPSPRKLSFDTYLTEAGLVKDRLASSVTDPQATSCMCIRMDPALLFSLPALGSLYEFSDFAPLHCWR